MSKESHPPAAMTGESCRVAGLSALWRAVRFLDGIGSILTRRNILILGNPGKPAALVCVLPPTLTSPDPRCIRRQVKRIRSLALAALSLRLAFDAKAARHRLNGRRAISRRSKLGTPRRAGVQSCDRRPDAWPPLTPTRRSVDAAHRGANWPPATLIPSAAGVDRAAYQQALASIAEGPARWPASQPGIGRGGSASAQRRRSNAVAMPAHTAGAYIPPCSAVPCNVRKRKRGYEEHVAVPSLRARLRATCPAT